MFWIPGGKGPGCPGRYEALDSGDMLETFVDVSLCAVVWCGPVKGSAVVVGAAAGVVGADWLGVELGGVTGGGDEFSFFWSACNWAACDCATKFDMNPVWLKAVRRSRAACWAARISKFDLNSSNVLFWSFGCVLIVGNADKGDAEPLSEAISWRTISGLSVECSSTLAFSSDSNVNHLKTWSNYKKNLLVSHFTLFCADWAAMIDAMSNFFRSWIADKFVCSVFKDISLLFDKLFVNFVLMFLHLYFGSIPEQSYIKVI